MCRVTIRQTTRNSPNILVALFTFVAVLCASTAYGQATEVMTLMQILDLMSSKADSSQTRNYKPSIRSCDKESELAVMMAEKVSNEYVTTKVELKERHERNVATIDEYTAELSVQNPEYREDYSAMADLLKEPPQFVPIAKYDKLYELAYEHNLALIGVINCTDDQYEDLRREILRLF